MRTDINYKELKKKIQWAYDSFEEKCPQDNSLDTALKIFKVIKAFERFNGDDEVDYKRELMEAKMDLKLIFDIPVAELNKMTKNNIYMLHQSQMVNAIFMMLNNEELKND